MPSIAGDPPIPLHGDVGIQVGIEDQKGTDGFSQGPTGHVAEGVLPERLFVLLQGIVEIPDAHVEPVDFRRREVRGLLQCLARDRVSGFLETGGQKMHGAGMQAIVRLHAGGPFAVVPAPICRLACNDGKDHLGSEQVIQTLAGGPQQTGQGHVQGIGIQFRADPPILGPDLVVLVEMAMDQVQIEIGGPLVSGMGTP